MPALSDKRTKLLDLLEELFQLNQPELDFGLYRIMHAKSAQVRAFLRDDLPSIIERTFGATHQQDAQAKLEAARRRVVEQLGQEALNPDGSMAPIFAGTPVGKEYQEALAAARAESGVDTSEEAVYDHLYRFFSRYYDDGDFLSRRYYARETPDRQRPYAIPYSGEEVMLHWANADQYYVKTTEYFSNYTFNLRLDDPANPMPVHCRVVDAAEGEHNNVKETEKRYFIIHTPAVAWEDGAPVIQFEYRPDPAKTGQDATWQQKRRDEAEAAILGALRNTSEGEAYYDALRQPAGKDDTRTVLAKQLFNYTKRNTSDFFIHKNLGAFLRRELDFYIKNEVLLLDDVMGLANDEVARKLNLVRALREIAERIIVFLAQLEEFQKRLWLKKKFIVEAQYCITLDRIPEEMYPEIVANVAQLDEWKRLFVIEAIPQTLENSGYTEPLTVEFLKANPYLVLDTCHFERSFTDRLLASFDDCGELVDGLLIHSENFQALNLLTPSLFGKVKCIYIDPPYNTGDDGFLYKDNYQHSSWMSMMLDRLSIAKSVLSDTGLIFVQIGDDEDADLRLLLEGIFPIRKNSVVVRRGIKNVQAQFDDIERLSLGHDIIHVCSKTPVRLPHLQHSLGITKDGKWDTFWRGTDRATMRYVLFGIKPETGQWRWEENRGKRAQANYEYFLLHEASNKTLDEWYVENLQCGVDLDFVRLNDDGVVQYYVPPQTMKLVSDNWLDIPVAGSHTDFPHEKSLSLLRRVIGWNTTPGDVVVDFFAGSGSTIHAAMRFSDSASEARRYVGVEMGNYFDTTLKPRIQRFVYSKDWKDDKPVSREGISHMFKYVRLESYEDTLNNLDLLTPHRDSQVTMDSLIRDADPDAYEEYLLKYMLEVETRGSQSLLNIEGFANPDKYMLHVKEPGSDMFNKRPVDLLETFNYLLGLRVVHIGVPEHWTATFTRAVDEDLTEGERTRLVIDGWRGPSAAERGTFRKAEDGRWWFRPVEGWLPLPDGGREKALIVWRNLTGDPEQDNAMLDAWFEANRINVRDFEYDVIYANGDNNLPNLRKEGERWKVRLIEEEFHRLMWDVEGA